MFHPSMALHREKFGVEAHHGYHDCCSHRCELFRVTDSYQMGSETHRADLCELSFLAQV